MDFLTAEVWTPKGLETQHVLLAIELKTRCVELAGITPHPTESFMAQVARSLMDSLDGFLRDHVALICDRDSKFTERFRDTLRQAGVEVVVTPYLTPNCNAYAERFVLSLRSECLDRLILFGRHKLRRALQEYIEHYNSERPHQGIGNVPISGRSIPRRGPVTCQERLGGLLKHYRVAA